MTLDKTSRAALLAAVVDATVSAGFIVWDHFCRASTVEYKQDASPVTEADRAAEAVILAALRAAAPHIAIVAEEEAAAGRIPQVGAAFFLVDPLDGTKEFIKRGTDFTVNIGLIEQGAPTMGAVYAPARSTLYWGDTVLQQAWRAPQPPHGMRGARRTNCGARARRPALRGRVQVSQYAGD